MNSILAGLGVLSLLASGVAFGGIQVCFTESFLLHAMVFPLNPQTIAQPTAFTYLGIACEFAMAVFLPHGVILLLTAAWRSRSPIGHRIPIAVNFQ